MVEMYFNLVINGKRTCNPENKEVKQVPKSVFDEVLAMLTENGYDADGQPLV